MASGLLEPVLLRQLSCLGRVASEGVLTVPLLVSLVQQRLPFTVRWFRFTGYDRCCSSGPCSRIFAADMEKPDQTDLIPEEAKFSEKVVAAFARKHPLDGCPRVYGLSICKTRDKALIKFLVGIHQSLWKWISDRWVLDSQEGSLMMRVEAFAGSVLKQALVVILSRSLGIPDG